MSLNFREKLHAASRKADSALCVGLDPRLERLSGRGLDAARPLFDFCRQIVDATAPYVCAFKPQFACFGAVGAVYELQSLIEYIHAEYPKTPVILDAKRGDIGATAELYAEEAFGFFKADAVTVNPYLGWDAIEPFTRRAERGVVILCHTSNVDGAWLQEHPPTDPVYLRVVDLAVQHDQGNLALVVGATFPEQIAAVRRRAPDLPLLVPGIGTQSGDVEAVFANGLASGGGGLIVNASRSVIYASADEDWAQAAGQAAAALRDDMRRARAKALARTP